MYNLGRWFGRHLLASALIFCALCAAVSFVDVALCIDHAASVATQQAASSWRPPVDPGVTAAVNRAQRQHDASALGMFERAGSK